MNKKKSNKAYVQESLENRILHGLSCEWDAALWLLEPALAKLMKKPLFALKDFRSKYGTWSPVKREISFSRDFVLNYPWYSIREVLFHEMAHQFTHEVLRVTCETSHGPAFQKACRLLRANPEATGYFKPLNIRVEDEEGLSENDKLLSRVRKLMALAESSNRHEAEAAMAKAHKLIKKHNIEILENDEKRDFLSVFTGKPSLRQFRDAYHMARLLQEYYFVNCLWVSAYVIEKEKMGKVLEVSGTIKNVKLASYVYDYINQFTDNSWTEYNSEKKLGRHRKTDFSIGIIEGFRSKLEKESQKSVAAGEKGIVEIRDPKLQEYVSYKYPHTRKFSRKASGQDAGVYNDGKKIGKKLVISKGVTEKKDGKTELIGL